MRLNSRMFYYVMYGVYYVTPMIHNFFLAYIERIIDEIFELEID